MAHGTPDYWGAAPKSTTYGSMDVAELAARLGSPVNFDRRGDVMYITTFAQGWGMIVGTGSGAGNTACIASYWPLHGSLHAVLNTGTDVGGFRQAYIHVFYPVLGGLGIEASFIPMANLRSVDLSLTLYDGANALSFRCQYNHPTGTIKVYASDAAWHTVGTPGIMPESYSSYVIMKLVCNSLTGKFCRVMFNGSTYLADGYSGLSGANATRKGMIGFISAYTDVAAAVEIPVGHIIITQNEPD